MPRPPTRRDTHAHLSAQRTHLILVNDKGRERQVPVQDVPWEAMAHLQTSFTPDELLAAQAAASRLRLIIAPRTPRTNPHRAPRSVHLTAPVAARNPLPPLHGQLLGFPGAVCHAPGHYEFAPWATPDLLDLLTAAGHVPHLTGTLLTECADLSERYAGPYEPDRANLYLQPPLDGSGLCLALYGPYQAQRVTAAQAIPGRRWTGEADEFPLTSAGAVHDLLTRFAGVSHLTPDQHATVKAAVQADEQAQADAQQAARERVAVYPTTIGGRRRVAFDFPKNPTLTDLIRTACDVVFTGPPESARPLWHADPTHLPQILDAAHATGLRVHPDLTAQAEAFSAETTRTRALASEALNLRDDDALGLVSAPPMPGLRTTLLPHQALPAALWPLTRKLLLADEQGLGKSIEAISVILAHRATLRRVVIVCPSGLTATWTAEFQEHAPDALHVTVLDGEQPSGVPAHTDVCVVGWSVLHAWEPTISEWTPDLLIVDEGQLGKARGGPWGSQRGEAAQRLAATVRLHGAGGGVIVMTGTPIDTRPLDALALLDLLGETYAFGGPWAYKQRYCAPTTVRRRGQRPITTYQGASHTRELHDRLDAHPWFVRRTKRLLIRQGLISPKTVNGVDWYDLHTPEQPIRITLPPAAMAEYRAATLEFRQYLTDLLLAAHPDALNLPEEALLALLTRKMRNVLPKLALLREVAGHAKIAQVTEHVRTLNAQGEQVLVIAHHRAVVDAYARALCGPKILKLQGGMNARATEDTKRYFNTHGVEDAPVLILSQDAGKLGHTLCLQRKLAGLPEACHVVIAEESPSPGGEAQAMDRVWRIPQTRPVTVQNVIARDTLDEGLYLLRRAKRRAAAVITDGEAVDGDANLSGMLAAWIHGHHFTEGESPTP